MSEMESNVRWRYFPQDGDTSLKKIIPGSNTGVERK